MAQIIDDIRIISEQIENLKSSIQGFEKEISKATAASANIGKLFSGYKAADAGAMSVESLTRAVSELTKGYDTLSIAQENAKAKLSALRQEQQSYEQLKSAYGTAQRDALKNGDQQGATDMYNKYISAAQAANALSVEIARTGREVEMLNQCVNTGSMTMSRYELILGAVQATQGKIDIERLQAEFDAADEELKGLRDTMVGYVEQIKTLQEQLKGGKLTPQETEETKQKIESTKNSLNECAEAYKTAAEQARVYAKALGKDEKEISLKPDIEMPKEEIISRKTIDNAKELKKELSGVESLFQGIVKGGLALTGIQFGLGSMKNFANQVMHTRGEFQKLEVAFTTMLQSKSKAETLMQQLTKTAATTPFDLQSVSKGAKQLLAYGTAAGDVNDILIHLGDIAAGLSQPLDALVYLYGTTMVQGKMMTRDLRQFQNRGIPIAEQLAKQFGIARSEVESYVSAGRVTAEEFHKAVMGMASDGGKFAGLMSEQAKTITGQISNIEDSIDMMFNEIGKESEGVINTALAGVSKLVENYESVGKTIVGLVAAYGTYKAALMVTAALEAARNKQARLMIVNGGKQVSLMKMLTAATYKQIAAQLKANAAALANPYLLVAAALASLVYVIINWTKWMDKAHDVSGKVNNKYNERINKIEEEKVAAEDLIETLKSETATTYDLLAAKDALSKMDAFKNKNIAGMSPEEIQKILQEWEVTEKQKAQDDKIKGLNKGLKESKEDYVGSILESSKESALKSMRESVKVLTENNYAKYSKGKTDEQIEAELIRLRDKAIGNKNAIQKKNTGKDSDKFDIALYEEYAKNYQQQIDNLKENQKQAEKKYKEENSGQTLSQLIYGYNSTDKSGNNTFINGIVQQEQAVEKARNAYSKNTSEKNKKAVDDAEATLKDLTDKYKRATGEQWISTKDFLKTKENEERDAARKSIDILHGEYSERVKLADKYQQQIQDLEVEKAEWREKNQGRTLPKYFADKEAVINAQYEFDRAKLDKEFNEWIEDIERKTISVNTEMEIGQLERAISLADDYNTKLEKRRQLNKIEIDERNKELDKEKADTAKDRFGEKTIERYEQYKGGGLTDVSAEEEVTFAQLERFYTTFEQQRSAIIRQMEQEDSNAQFEEDMRNFETFADGILQAEENYQSELASIRAKYGLDEGADIEHSTDANIKAEVRTAQVERDRATAIVKRDTGMEDDEQITKLANIGAQVAGKAKDEIRKIYDEFIEDVNKDIEDIESRKTESENIIASERKTQAEKTSQLNDVNTQLATEGLDPQTEQDLLAQRAQLEAEIAASIQLQADETARLNELNGKLSQLINVRGQAEKNAANSVSNAQTKQEKSTKEQRKNTQALVGSLEAVRDAADSIADTFGGVLSKKGKKALNAISQIADFGINAVNSISSLVTSVSKGMEATTASAVADMSALEKASFILTIISLAVQLIMKIVEIAKQFTAEAKLQDSIDDHLAKVEELERKQQLIEAQYATSQGSEYYKGLAKSAERYNAIIEENNKALREAEQLYQLNVSKYGADSDKAQEAKEQYDELELQDQEYRNEQKEAYRELMEELSGTSLDSFAENLADALIEGFAMGREGIDEVWEDTMDDILRTMMRNELALALKNQFKNTFENFAYNTSDGDLSQADMDEFMNNLEQGKAAAEQIANAYYEAMSTAGLLDDEDAEGSKGFGQMTQDQADTLTARFTALQIEGANISAATGAVANAMMLMSEDIKNVVGSIQGLLYNSNIALQMAQDRLDQLQIIADNTAMLSETNNRLKAIEQNTGRL